MKKILSFCFTLVLFLAFGPFSSGQSYMPVRNDNRFKIKPVIKLQAYGFAPSDVKLLEGSVFYNAMQKDAAYLLQIEPDRLLARFYENAGLPVKAQVYGGWESEGLPGHTLGHYLSAISLMYASSGNAEFKKRADYIVAELARCQNARGSGYVGAIPNEDSLFYKVSKGDIHSSGFDLNGGWAPWYTVHKVMAGLLDTYLYCGNNQALKVATSMADWAENILKDLSLAQMQKMLRCEYGGMNDVLAQLYAITADKKYLDLSYRFYDDFVMQPLSQRIDPLPGKHANTNVPKTIGSASQYELTGNKGDSTIAAFTWNTLVNHHSYVIGGNGNYEYLGPEDKFNDRLSDNTAETCVSYNMLKLTKHLFSWHPSAGLGDYYERTLYNHILASQHPETGMMCYFVPLRMGSRKTFSGRFDTFTCCVGTGIENHAKYAEDIFYESADAKSLFVNLFIPSQLNWKATKTTVTIRTGFPNQDQINLLIQPLKDVKFALKLRRPYWAENFELEVNEIKIKPQINQDGFLVIDRVWKKGDQVKFTPHKALHAEALADNASRIALMYGPIVLAGDLGDTLPDAAYGTPVLLTDNRNIGDWISPVPDRPMHFKMKGVGKPYDPELKPFYESNDNYYSVYWDFFTHDGWTSRQKDYQTEKERQRKIGERTIDEFRIGEMQPERDHELKASANSYIDPAIGVNGREARSKGFFSFKMKVDPSLKNNLLLTYIGDDKNRKFDILVDGTVIRTVEWDGGETGKFYDFEYGIDPGLLKDKTLVRIGIEANYGKTAGRVFGVKIVK
ncbi:beta-L-arabinofuranosidase domain-containing protein [Dyadobacter subterraneus]|uniref:Glycoside hydrolase family 127 protein n=1 Tax=Dyadobacter subterraneus TaxID=2773304 RepID=A0ABR9WEI0_9BACT|nr:glycoside hydrolase family 127 protein [Dyadobacter subterraneus]MBE9463902.1 glycoside hydrolase family 127 protein [Dyadobacter subterraneus]